MAKGQVWAVPRINPVLKRYIFLQFIFFSEFSIRLSGPLRICVAEPGWFSSWETLYNYLFQNHYEKTLIKNVPSFGSRRGNRSLAF